MSMNGRTIRLFAIAAIAWALAAGAYAALRLTFDRAPTIHVRWAHGIDDRARARLENQFALTDARQDSERTWVYILTSPSTANIQALVQHPAVEDTHHIDRTLFVVTPSARRPGPYLTAAPRWIPAGLEMLSVALAVAGAGALGFATLRSASRSLFFERAADGVTRRVRASSIAGTVALLGGLAFLWTRYYELLQIAANRSDPFRVGDWLVSYETGFVRRGLPGLPILWATERLATRPEAVIFWMHVSLYAALFVVLLFLAGRKRPNVWFLAFLFSPAALLFPVYDPAAIGRKDVLFLVAFAVYALWMPRPAPAVNLLTFALGAAVTLSHELFFFYTPWFFVMRLLASDDPRPRRFAPELSLFAGSLAAVVLASTAGADMHGERLCQGLLERGFQEQLCDGIMRYRVTTIRDSIAETVTTAQGENYLLVYGLAAVLAALPLLAFFATRRARIARAVWIAAGAALLFTVPMFAVVLDWGRLLNIHVMAIAIVIATSVLEQPNSPAPFFGTAKPWLAVVIVPAVALYLTGWSIAHCCADPFGPGLFR